MNDNHIADEREQGDKATCGACNGTGRMVRDPDIGTDQECFACDGSGIFEDAPIAPRAGAENDELIGRMDWCIKWATMGEATRQVMIDARALLAAPIAPRDITPMDADEHFGKKLSYYAAPIAPRAGADTAGANSSAWFSVAMNAAAYLEDAANCLTDPDAKQAAKGAAAHTRKRTNELWAAADASNERADAEKDAALTDVRDKLTSALNANPRATMFLIEEARDMIAAILAAKEKK